MRRHGPVIVNCTDSEDFPTMQEAQGFYARFKLRLHHVCVIHIVHNLIRGMPCSSMLFCSNLNSLASLREDLSRSFFKMF